MARSSAKATGRVMGAVAFGRLLLGCAAPDGCLGGDDGACVPQSACDGVSYACRSPALVLKWVDSPDERPRGHAALAAIGDVLFEPWRFFAVGAGAVVRLRAGNDPGFEALEPRATLRFYAGPALLDLAAAMPLFGQDRTDLLLSASLGLVGW